MVAANQPIGVTAILFGKLAQMWRKDYVDNPKVKLATPTREKYRSRLDNHNSRGGRTPALVSFTRRMFSTGSSKSAPRGT